LPVSTPTRTALILTLRLGLRALETCSLEWRAVDIDGAAPSITVTRSKTGAGLRALPLPRAAVETLRELRANSSKDQAFLFPAEAGSRRARHMHPESLSRAFARACARLGIADASTHDLRRTCLSGLIELGHKLVADRIAGHAPRHVIGRHYDRSKRLDAMRDGLEAWSAAIDAAATRYAREVKK
jgi:integrase